MDVIRDAYPTHAVHAEESGRTGDSRYEWVVDPLDGTNNFAAGVPMFASAVCVRRDGRPMVTAVYEPLPDCLYLARRGAGATADGDPITADSAVSLPEGTVSFVVGLPAIRDPERRTTAERLESAIDGDCKRVLDTWSPCVDWGVLARGGIEGLVAYYPDVYEQYAGELLAAEAGVRYRVLDPETGAVIGGNADERGGDDPATTGVGNLYVGAAAASGLDRLTAAVREVLEAPRRD
jgi:myo-inositol-1(or 4)-monophosphatase